MMDDTQRAHWLAARAGKLTASRMKDAMAFKKDGTPTQDRSNYMRDLLAERLTGLSTRHYVNPAMEWGLANEDAAKRAYEASTGNLIAEAGFYDHPSIDMVGASPDGLVDHDGLVETKAPTTSTHVAWMMAGVVPEEHRPQMILQCACTGRKWCDFVSFDPRIKEPAKQLFVRRFQPEPKDITSIELLATMFVNELDQLWEAFHTKAA